MKSDLVQLLRGVNLKNQIYKTISKHKFGSTTRLRHAFNTHAPRYIDFKSEDPGIKTEMGSPGKHSEFSLQKLSKSVNQAWSSRRKEKKEGSRSKDCKLQRSQKNEHRVHQKIKSKSQILPHRKVLSQQSHYPQNQFPSKAIGLHKKSEKKIKKQSNPDNSSLKSGNKELQSIIEQSSSQEQLITPENKRNNFQDDSQLSQSKTKKKDEKYQHFSDSFKKKVEKSFKEPETFQKILKTAILTVSYRILKKTLIEVEILVLKPLQSLIVTIQKGNLECQSINEEYHNLSSNTVLALFSPVRNLCIDKIEDFPKLKIEGLTNEQEKIDRKIILPYTWLHFVNQKFPSLKKSKIKTKICLCDLPFSTTQFRILSDIFPNWLKKGFKGHSEFQTGFSLGDQQFTLQFFEEISEKFTLELQGKGEAKLTSMIEFLQHLIC